jgi:GT2 family glycosyltransferase
MPTVSVVIPTWGQARWLGRCLEALSRQTLRDFEVIVIWNEARSDARPRIPPGLDLRLITNPKNVGFAAAVNQGIRLARAEYVAILNDDAFPEPDWLETLLDTVSRAADIGAGASLMVFDHAPDLVQSAGIAIDRAAICWDRLRGRPAAEAGTTCEVFGASAGAALYRRSMLDRLGSFDERFFAYLEDADLAWRAGIAGWRAVYVPRARVRHVTSATLGEGSPAKKLLLGRNKIWMATKNAPAADLPVILAYDLAAVIYALVRRRDPYPLRGRLEGLRWVRAFLGDRQPGRPRVLEPLVPPWKVPERFGPRPHLT